MTIFVAEGFFIFGTIIGSFLNVVILRYNTGATLRGRSRCFSCGKTILWYDLVPILSFLLLRGRCRFCRSTVSPQYPLVELASGFLFLGVFLRYFSASPIPDFSILYSLFSTLYLPFSIDLFVFCLLLVIAVYDLTHKIIPDKMVFLFAVLSLGKLFLSVPFSDLFRFPHLLDLLAGPLLALPFCLLWLVSRGRWMGLGDGKLALGLGWFLGFSLGVSAVVLGFWLGAVVGLTLVALARLRRARFVPKFLLNAGLKNLTMKSEVPFAPFLIAGFVIVYFFGIDVVGVGPFSF